MLIDVHGHFLNAQVYPKEIFFNRFRFGKSKIIALIDAYESLGKFAIPFLEKTFRKFGSHVQLNKILDLLNDSTQEYTFHLLREMEEADIDEMVVNLIDFSYKQPDPKLSREIYREIVESLLKIDRLHVFLGYDSRTIPIKDLWPKVAGFKIYPARGFDPNTCEELFEYCVTSNKPITVHCSKGGIGKSKHLTNPQIWWDILAKYPTLKVNFAHFGGNTQFIDHFSDGNKPLYVLNIIGLMREYPNVYADIAFHNGAVDNKDKYLNAVRSAMDNIWVADRLLFGTDWPLNLMEYPTKTFVKNLKEGLGNEIMTIIGEVNPQRFLLQEE